MNNTVLLTARKGSKLKDKCFLELNSKNCIQYPIKESKKVDMVDQFFCSSDSEKILNFANSEGFKPVLRPSNLSSDEASHFDVITHFLEEIQNAEKIDILIILLGNAPIIFADWIEEAIKWIKNNPNFTSVVPVYKYNDHSPYRSKIINKEGYLSNMKNLFDSDTMPTNRQMLPATYFLCHNFWALNLNHWKNNSPPSGYPPWNFLGKKVKPLVVPKSHDIHELEDVSICEEILNWYSKNSSFKSIKLK